MSTTVLKNVLCLIAGLCIGCESNGSKLAKVKDDEKMKCIAVVGSADAETQKKVRDILARNGIESLIEGSTVYGVHVPSMHVSMATRLLKESSELNEGWIEFRDVED